MSYLDDLITKYEEEISNVKLISNSTLPDEKIAFAINKAGNAIGKYTSLDYTVIKNEYQSALITLAIIYLNNDNMLNSLANGNRVIKSVSQGARSTTYDNDTITLDRFGLTKEIRGLLPLPKLKVM